MAYDQPIAPGEDVQTGDPRAEAPEKPLGMFQLADDQLVKRLRTLLKRAFEHHSKRREERKKEWDALANDQWAENDKTRMSGQKRTTLTLNLLQTMLAAVEGEERINRQEIKFYGVEEGDDADAAGMNRLLKWIMDQCGGEFALSSQFRSGCGVGEGWVVATVDFFEDPDGMIKLEFVDEDEMLADPQSNVASDPTAANARHLFRHQMFEEDEIEARWPGKIDELQLKVLDMEPGSETDGKGYRDVYLTPDDVKGPKICDSKERQWMIVEAWWTQIEPGMVVVNEQTGELDEVSPDDFAMMKADRLKQQQAWVQTKLNPSFAPADPMNPMSPAMPVDPGPMPPPLQAKERPLRCFYQAFFCGDVLLEKRKCEIKDLRRYPYVRFGAILDKSKKNWYGLLLLAMDIQRQHNVEQSAIIQLIQQLPQGSWMGPKGSFHNKNEWIEKVAQPGRLLEYNASRGKPEQIETPPIPRHLVELAMARPNQLREITGINSEMTGQRTPDAGVVMEMRKKAATTVLAPIFDNYRRSKIEVGKVLRSFIQTYIKPGRRVRIIGEGKAGWAIATTQMTEGRFDLKIEEANASINDRMETLTVMQTTLPQLIQAGVPIPPEFVDLLPMNPDIRDACKRLIAWHLTVNNLLPPPDWQPGMPNPLLLPAPAAPVDPSAVPPAQ